MLSFGHDAGFESFPPLVNVLVHNRLFQVSPYLNKSLLQFSQITNRFLMYTRSCTQPQILQSTGFQVRTTRQPQVRWNEIWRFITQEFDCWSCSVGWCVVLLEDVRVSCQMTETATVAHHGSMLRPLSHENQFSAAELRYCNWHH